MSASSSPAARLSVNVDHVATLRQARGTSYPDPVEAARRAEAAGATGITVHLRGDRRHIQEADVERLRRSVGGRLNLEIAATAEMVSIARRHRPDLVTLVPERPDEVTTEGGLDLRGQGERIAEAVRELAEAGLAVSLFLDPDPDQVEAAVELAARGGGDDGDRDRTVEGVEINTDAYARATDPEARHRHLEAIQQAATRLAAAGLHVYAGHALTPENVGPVAAVPEIEELNIGHALVSRAVLVGMEEAVGEFLRAMGGGG